MRSMQLGWSKFMKFKDNACQWNHALNKRSQVVYNHLANSMKLGVVKSLYRKKLVNEFFWRVQTTFIRDLKIKNSFLYQIKMLLFSVDFNVWLNLDSKDFVMTWVKDIYCQSFTDLNGKSPQYWYWRRMLKTKMLVKSCVGQKVEMQLER